MMRSCAALLLCLLLLTGAALAEDTAAAAIDPFLPVQAGSMTATDAEPGENGAVTVQTGTVLSASQVDFATGGAVIRVLAAAPEGGRLTIRIYLDAMEGMPLGTAVFSPITKEFRLSRSVEGVHDVFIAFDGDGTFISWQVFPSVEAIEEALRAERTGKYDDAIPTRYEVKCEHRGTVDKLTYTAHDYVGDQSPYEKAAFVYLPYGYDPAQTYPLLILCHGVGGNEYEWGMNTDTSKVRAIMDNLIDRGEIRPFIVVTPNGRGGHSEGYESFYTFDQELRHDLLPALAERYAVDITDRDLCAMAGLSMGGMQTINLGLGNCLDLFSWFGAFSAAPTSNTAATIAAMLNTTEGLPIHMFYNICGTEDTIALSAASGAVNQLANLTDKLDDSNFIVQLVPGGHDFSVWYLGFYNFARLFGSVE